MAFVDLVDKDMAKKATEFGLCDHCLGRLFAKVDHGMTNQKRGEALREAISSSLPEKCYLCENLFDELDTFSELVIKKLQLFEYETFLMGSKIDAEIVDKEERLWGEVGSEVYEPIKAEINREVGKLVEKKTGKEVNFDRPDITAVIDTRFDSVELQIASLFLYGRYKKLVRGIPQTRWPCRTCWGKGCAKCGGTGKMYQTSVEEIVAKEVMEASEGHEHSFHGMGREDIDARMLGNGRPFVLEIKNPVKRSIDLNEMEKLINKHGEGRVEVTDLRKSSKKEVVAIKDAVYPKTYEVHVEFEQPVKNEKLKEVVCAFKGSTIEQKTPKRVLHRRADLVRSKRVIDIDFEFHNEKGAIFRITGESGIYVKELIHGDYGRTKPSIAEYLNMKCDIKTLDVTHIHDENGGRETW